MTKYRLALHTTSSELGLAIAKDTGLGLSISYQIIAQKHQGELTCVSEPGRAEFCIEIPIYQSKNG